MYVEEINDKHLHDFTIVERVVSVLSLVGCVFIIASFSLSKAFQYKPINRLVFYASIGNMMTNIATLMARSYVGDALSPGCQLQAFLIQMFMPADAFWTLAMAVNVYLTFYYKYDAQKLRKMEIPYLLCCYGIPFVVALTYVFVTTKERGPVYGNATIWCWVSSSWDAWRIATFYGPVWVTIVVTFSIYFRAGREIYLKHRQLKDLNYSSRYGSEALPINDPFNSKTTEVTVVSEARGAIDLSTLGIGPSTKQLPSISTQPIRPAAYSVSISARPCTSGGRTRSPSRASANNNTAAAQQPKTRRNAAIDANNAAWSYTKVAMLFFTAMLVTWIPSSANRLYSLAADGQVNLALEYMSAFVLPLQGFWNAIIYCTTSWKACTMLGDDIAALFSRKPAVVSGGGPSLSGGGGLAGVWRTRSRLGIRDGNGNGKGRGFVRRELKGFEIESMEELADRRMFSV